MPNATKRIIIMGAAGRDFHNFNVAYRDDPTTEVVAFTAAQIPGIGDRRYPTELAASRYPNGIPILSEIKLAELVTQERIDQVVFAYSDVTHLHVMHQAYSRRRCGLCAARPASDDVDVPAPRHFRLRC